MIILLFDKLKAIVNPDLIDRVEKCRDAMDKRNNIDKVENGEVKCNINANKTENKKEETRLGGLNKEINT